MPARPMMDRLPSDLPTCLRQAYQARVRGLVAAHSRLVRTSAHDNSPLTTTHTTAYKHNVLLTTTHMTAYKHNALLTTTHKPAYKHNVLLTTTRQPTNTTSYWRPPTRPPINTTSYWRPQVRLQTQRPTNSVPNSMNPCTITVYNIIIQNNIT